MMVRTPSKRAQPQQFRQQHYLFLLSLRLIINFSSFETSKARTLDLFCFKLFWFSSLIQINFYNHFHYHYQVYFYYTHFSCVLYQCGQQYSYLFLQIIEDNLYIFQMFLIVGFLFYNLSFRFALILQIHSFSLPSSFFLNFLRITDNQLLINIFISNQDLHLILLFWEVISHYYRHHCHLHHHHPFWSPQVGVFLLTVVFIINHLHHRLNPFHFCLIQPVDSFSPSFSSLILIFLPFLQQDFSRALAQTNFLQLIHIIFSFSIKTSSFHINLSSIWLSYLYGISIQNQLSRAHQQFSSSLFLFIFEVTCSYVTPVPNSQLIYLIFGLRSVFFFVIIMLLVLHAIAALEFSQIMVLMTLCTFNSIQCFFDVIMNVSFSLRYGILFIISALIFVLILLSSFSPFPIFIIFIFQFIFSQFKTQSFIFFLCLPQSFGIHNFQLQLSWGCRGTNSDRFFQISSMVNQHFSQHVRLQQSFPR